jgi:peroxisome proliferator-activated receptor gamma coactivator-related protein 1
MSDIGGDSSGVLDNHNFFSFGRKASLSGEWDHDSQDTQSEPDGWDDDDISHLNNHKTVAKRESRKRKNEQPLFETSERLFDKLPNYYTALSIPARAVAGSTARSSSNLVTEFACHDRDPSPDRDADPMYNKLPAYHNSFMNSLRYDNAPAVAFLTNFDEFESTDKPVDDDWFGQFELSGSVQCETTSGIVRTKTDMQQEKRRIVYVGRIPRSLTALKLRKIFEQFGEITNCSVHFREHGDNYGFVTFAHSTDAGLAVEHGTSVAGCEKFDICFGGRRQFCKDEYADLDGKTVVEEELMPFISTSKDEDDVDFDCLLRVAKQRLGHSSTSCS